MMTSVRWNVRKRQYDLVVDDCSTIVTQIKGETVHLCNCPYCGKYHDLNEVSDSEGDLHGLSVFCSEECRDAVLGDLGSFCPECGGWRDKGDCHDVDGYEEYCEDCAQNKKAEHDEWEAEKAHLRKCML